MSSCFYGMVVGIHEIIPRSPGKGSAKANQHVFVFVKSSFKMKPQCTGYVDKYMIKKSNQII